MQEATYRMRDLCELTGLERQAIHFYMKEGLVPEGKKTGRNTAVYGAEHLSRIRLIKKLQREQFLPLRAIAAVLDGKGGDFSPEQEALLVEVKSKLGPAFEAAPPEATSMARLCEKHGLERRDLEEMIELGIVTVTRSREGISLSSDDAALIELFGELKSAGFTRDVGFTARDLALYAAAVDQLFDEERKLLLERLGHLPPDAIAASVERAMPIIGSLLGRLHAARARRFFSTLGGVDQAPAASAPRAHSSSRARRKPTGEPVARARTR